MCAIYHNFSVLGVHVPHQAFTMGRSNDFIGLTIDEDSWNIDFDFMVEVDEKWVVTFPDRMREDLLE